MRGPVLIIDDDRRTSEFLLSQFEAAGVTAELAEEGLAAIEKLQGQRYSAVILDPMIRNVLNGYVVLNYIELEQPDVMERLFLLTAMSEQTIARTVPAALPRLFHKPSDNEKLVSAVLDACGGSEQRKNSGSVLLIEDDGTTASVLRRVSEELGYRVMVVQSGRDALDQLFLHEYGAILLDLVMPDPDAFAVLQYLEQRGPDLLRRVIVTTGIPERYTASIDRTRVCAVLRKPVDPQQLSATLQDCINLGRGKVS